MAPTELAMTNKDSPFRLEDCFGIAETAWMTKRVQKKMFVNPRYFGYITAKPLRGPNTGYYAVSIYSKYRIREAVEEKRFQRVGRN